MTEIETEKTVALFDRAANKKILESLTKKAVEVLPIEPPTIRPLGNSAETSQILENLTACDWLILTDVFAAEIAIEKIEETGIDLFELDRLRICVAGESVADRLRYRQIHADVVSNLTGALEIFDDLKSYDYDLNERKIILPVEINRLSKISELLRAEQCNVSEIPVYETVFPDRENLIKTKIKLTGGAADEFVFTAPEEVVYLAKYFATENLASFVSEMKTIALDPATYQALREFGISRAILSVGSYPEMEKEKND